MSNAKSNKPTLNKVTVVADANLLDSVQRHRQELAERTGLNVSLSAATAQLIRAGLASQRQAPSH
jgi:hypothetical protein